MQKIVGTGVALVTPFENDGKVDCVALERLVEHTIAGNVEFLVVFGTTGEPVTMTADEKKSVIDCVKSTNSKRVPIVIGCGSNNTTATVNDLKDDYLKDADAILSVAPYYNKPSQEGIFQHYKAIAEASPAPIIAYNVPGRTGSNIEVNTALRIANEIDNVIGLKEASPSVEQFTYIAKGIPDNFSLVSGDDSLIVPHMSLGAQGAISVTANAFPAEYSKMIRLCLAGQFDEALAMHFNLIEFTDSLFEEGSPSGVKAALEIMGIMKKNVRLPLTTVTEGTYKKIEELIRFVKKQ